MTGDHDFGYDENDYIQSKNDKKHKNGYDIDSDNDSSSDFDDFIKDYNDNDNCCNLRTCVD